MENNYVTPEEAIEDASQVVLDGEGPFADKMARLDAVIQQASEVSGGQVDWRAIFDQAVQS